MGAEANRGSGSWRSEPEPTLGLDGNVAEGGEPASPLRAETGRVNENRLLASTAVIGGGGTERRGEWRACV